MISQNSTRVDSASFNREGAGTSKKDEALKYYVTTFYHFKPTSDLHKISDELYALANRWDLQGLIILGKEGINSTMSSPSPEGLNALKGFVTDRFGCPDLFFKDSESSVRPFRRFVVKIRDEIVTLGTPELAPFDLKKNHHLSPQEWNEALRHEDVVLIDTRNWYETQIGTFRGSLIPNIDQFTEFPSYLESQNIPKDKKILIFCTGGIRCEKGILDLQKEGYDNVYQLEGGIINYLKECPHQEFEGECFVFDHRVALDQNLLPTQKYGLCPHCGQPGSQTIECRRCDTPSYICEDCLQIEVAKDTCSKNCAHHYRLHPHKKGPRQKPGWMASHSETK